MAKIRNERSTSTLNAQRSTLNGNVHCSTPMFNETVGWYTVTSHSVLTVLTVLTVHTVLNEKGAAAPFNAFICM